MSSQNCCPEVGACHLVLIFVPLMLGGFFHLEWFWDECECVVDLKSSSVVVDLERHKVQIWSRSFWHCLKDGVGVLFCCGFLTNSSSASLQPAPRKDELVLRFYFYPVTFFSGAVGFSYWICFLCAYSCLSFLQISCQFEIKITPKLSKLISKIIMTELSFHSFLSSLPNPVSYLKPKETKSWWFYSCADSETLGSFRCTGLFLFVWFCFIFEVEKLREIEVVLSLLKSLGAFPSALTFRSGCVCRIQVFLSPRIA